MRKRKETPKGETIVFRAGAKGASGIRVEFTRNFERSKLLPDLATEDLDGAVFSALKASLASTNKLESVNAAEVIIRKSSETDKLDDLKLTAVNVIIEYAVKKKEWFRVRELLDHNDREIRAHANEKLDLVLENEESRRL